MDLPKNLLTEEIVEDDPARVAVQAYNDGSHLSAVLMAQPLAEDGNPYALLIMGLAYESGKGVEQSQELALKNLRKASEAGSKEAPYRLARLLVTSGGDDQKKEAHSILKTKIYKDSF